MANPSLPPFPFEVGYLWDWFNEFSWGLTPNPHGPATATWGDVLEWSESADVETEPWERRALVRLAGERARVLLEAVKPNGDKGKA